MRLVSPRRPVQPDDDHAADFSIEREYEKTTLGRLLERFYEFNTGLDLDRGWIGYRLNPPQYTPRLENIYFFAHYGDYIGRIDCNPNRKDGVHRCRLYYICRQIDAKLWVASAQLNPCFFFSEKKVINNYQRLVDEEEWYQTDREKNKYVIR